MSVPSAAHDRTRRRILDAAVALLGKDSGASLAEVAAHAGLGRTTVHRYFPTRDALLVALGVEAVHHVSDAMAAARLDDGTAAEATARLVHGLLPLADDLRYLDVGQVWGAPEVAEAWAPLQRRVDALVARGQREGDLRADLPAALVADLLLAAVWCVADSVAEGRVAANDAAPGVLAVLLHGAAAVRQTAP